MASLGFKKVSRPSRFKGCQTSLSTPTYLLFGAFVKKVRSLLSPGSCTSCCILYIFRSTGSSVAEMFEIKHGPRNAGFAPYRTPSLPTCRSSTNPSPSPLRSFRRCSSFSRSSSERCMESASSTSRPNEPLPTSPSRTAVMCLIAFCI